MDRTPDTPLRVPVYQEAVHYFGTWDKMPVIAGATSAATPVGAQCTGCGSDVLPPDLGLYLNPHYQDDDYSSGGTVLVNRSDLAVYHAECATLRHMMLNARQQAELDACTGPLHKRRTTLKLVTLWRQGFGMRDEDTEGGW
jgi:hypothetical protein